MALVDAAAPERMTGTQGRQARIVTEPGILVAGLLTLVAVSLMSYVIWTIDSWQNVELRVVAASTALILVGAATGFLLSGPKLIRLRQVYIGPWWALYYTLCFGATAYVWVSQQGDLAAAIDPSVIPSALLLATLGLAAWACGYLTRPLRIAVLSARRIARVATRSSHWTMRPPVVAIGIYAVGLVSNVLLLIGGRFGYIADLTVVNSPSSSAQVLAVASQGMLFGLALIALRVFAPGAPIRLAGLFWIMFAVQVAFSLVGGTKAALLFSVVIVTISYVAARGRMPRRIWWLVLGGVLVVMPLNLAYRDLVRGEGKVSTYEAVKSLPELMTKAFSPSGLSQSLRETPQQLGVRLRTIDNVAIIIQKTPSAIPFRGIGELIAAPIQGLIPRSVWTGKPVLSGGAAFTVEYYGSRLVRSASAVTFPGDLYRHGGVGVVVVGMFIVGALCRLTDDEFHPSLDPRNLIFYSTLFLLLMSFEADIISASASFLVSLGFAVLVTRAAFRPASPAAERGLPIGVAPQASRSAL